MVLTNTLKAKIDAMDYEQLLYEWRFAPLGSELFQGDSGIYIEQRMKDLRRSAVDAAKHTAASKSIGWEPKNQ